MANREIDSLRSLTQKTAGWLIGRTDRQLRNCPDAPRNEDGTYNAQHVVRWWIEKQTASLDTGPTTDNLERLRGIEGDIRALKLDQMRGSVVALEDVAHAANVILGGIRKSLIALQREHGADVAMVVADAVKNAEVELDGWLAGFKNAGSNYQRRV